MKSHANLSRHHGKKIFGVDSYVYSISSKER